MTENKNVLPPMEQEAWDGRPPKEYEGALAHILRSSDGDEHGALYSSAHVWLIQYHGVFLRVERIKETGWTYIAPLYPRPASSPAQVETAEAMREAVLKLIDKFVAWADEPGKGDTSKAWARAVESLRHQVEFITLPSDPAASGEVEEAHAYLSRLLRALAPQTQPLPDLLGLCTQVDNLIAGYLLRLGEHPDRAAIQRGATK